jgi:hypothetical protein
MVDFGLQGTIVLMTGAASGIGFACSRWFDAGYLVATSWQAYGGTPPARGEDFSVHSRWRLHADR